MKNSSIVKFYDSNTLLFSHKWLSKFLKLTLPTGVKLKAVKANSQHTYKK